MTKELPLTDFRAIRRALEPHEFAVGGEEIPPTDLIDQETWHEIMNLPDDVAITTSNHHGSRLRLLNSLLGDWVESVGPVDNQDELFSCMLNALECFQCAMFDLLHGFYRSALANLRSALEVVMIGAYGNIDPTRRRYLDWKNGVSELTFTPARRALLKLVKERPVGWLLEHDKLPARIFRDLCHFAHSRPGASDGDLWESNGPICSDKAVKLTFDACLQVYAICYLLIRIGRPNFKLREKRGVLFELDLLQGHDELLTAVREFGQPSG